MIVVDDPVTYSSWCLTIGAKTGPRWFTTGPVVDASTSINSWVAHSAS